MMKLVAIFCDKCGWQMDQKEFEKSGAVVEVMRTKRDTKLYALCNECTEKLKEWMVDR